MILLYVLVLKLECTCIGDLNIAVNVTLSLFIIRQQFTHSKNYIIIYITN